MRIEQLEYLAAVTQHGSLRRASEQLHVSQPALSEAVSKLERELGVTLLDRRRSGARISREGRELLPYMVEVLEAVDRLRGRGRRPRPGHPRRSGSAPSTPRTSTLLVPAIAAFHAAHPGTNVESLNMQQAEIDQGLLEGSLDLGLVNVLSGDDPPPDLVGTDLVHGRPVVVLPADHPLAAQPRDHRRRAAPGALRGDAGRLPDAPLRAPALRRRSCPASCTAPTAPRWASRMVAEGLGVTVLPDYSVVGDPLERAGLITARPIAGDRTAVTLVLRTRSSVRAAGPRQVRELHAALVARAREYAGTRASCRPRVTAVADPSARLAVLIDADNTSPTHAWRSWRSSRGTASRPSSGLRRLDLAAPEQLEGRDAAARDPADAAVRQHHAARTPPTPRSSSTRWTCSTRATSTPSHWCRATATSPGSRPGSASPARPSTAWAAPHPGVADRGVRPVHLPRGAGRTAAGRGRPERRGRRPLPDLRDILSPPAVEATSQEDGWATLGRVGNHLSKRHAVVRLRATTASPGSASWSAPRTYLEVERAREHPAGAPEVEPAAAQKARRQEGHRNREARRRVGAHEPVPPLWEQPQHPCPRRPGRAVPPPALTVSACLERRGHQRQRRRLRWQHRPGAQPSAGGSVADMRRARRSRPGRPGRRRQPRARRQADAVPLADPHRHDRAGAPQDVARARFDVQKARRRRRWRDSARRPRPPTRTATRSRAPRGARARRPGSPRRWPSPPGGRRPDLHRHRHRGRHDPGDRHRRPGQAASARSIDRLSLLLDRAGASARSSRLEPSSPVGEADLGSLEQQQAVPRRPDVVVHHHGLPRAPADEAEKEKEKKDDTDDAGFLRRAGARGWPRLTAPPPPRSPSSARCCPSPSSLLVLACPGAAAGATPPGPGRRRRRRCRRLSQRVGLHELRQPLRAGRGRSTG